MFAYPENLFVDVRIEDLYETQIVFALGNLEENRIREYSAAFIRLFDGQRWFYSSTSELENIQSEIDRLASLANPNINILNHPIVQKLPVTKDRKLSFVNENIAKIPSEKKIEVLRRNYEIVAENQYVTFWRAMYKDIRKVKRIFSSKGTDLEFDFQNLGYRVDYKMVHGECNFSESYNNAGSLYSDITGHEDDCRKYIQECEEFLLNSKPIDSGSYTVILSPLAAGVFAHESFGHKSEADFMVGDENMKKEWAIGTKVGADILSIVDTGLEPGTGYVPYDDEGTPAGKTFLVDKGVLSGRLHSGFTAAEMVENTTGNARSIGFEYEPIVRMTTTYILEGDQSKEELFAGVSDGLYIKTIKHGSGMSTFTIAPSLAYRIKDGKIAAPVNISVITGNVMSTLGEIDGLSDTVELCSFVGGGCGKMEQFPLPVGFGGPFVKVNNINVQ